MMEFRLVILLALQVFWVRRIVVLIYGLVYVLYSGVWFCDSLVLGFLVLGFLGFFRYA